MFTEETVYKGIPLNSFNLGARFGPSIRRLMLSFKLFLFRAAKEVIADSTNLVPSYGIDTSSVGCATNGSQILNEIFWKCTFTSNRAGIIISEKQKGDYKSADLNSAGHLKLSKYIDFDALPFCEPFVDTVKIECPLFGDEIVEIKETMGVGIRDVMNQVYAFFSEHPKLKKEAKGRDLFQSFTHVKGVTFKMNCSEY